MRLIDADAFAAFIKDAIKKQKYEDLKVDGLLTVADVLEAVVSELDGTSLDGLKNAPTVNQWISCSERLPEIGQYVICQCRAGIIDVLALDNDGIWFHDTEQEYYHDYVIAWMPLPEPAKLEGD